MTVYFVQDGGPTGHIKIGYTTGDPHTRIAAFRTGNPRPLTLLVSIPGTEAVEKALHERFASLRESGEWFRPDPRLLGFIEGMLHAYPEQPEPEADAASEPDTLYGLTREQAEALRGYVYGNSQSHEFRRVALDLGMSHDGEQGYVPSGKLDEDTLGRLRDALMRLEWYWEPEGSPWREGVKFFLQEHPMQSLWSWLKAALARHRAAVEQQAAKDAAGAEGGASS